MNNTADTFARRSDTPVEITIAPDAAVLATRIPAELKTRFEHGKLYAGNVIADYSAPAPGR